MGNSKKRKKKKKVGYNSLGMIAIALVVLVLLGGLMLESRKLLRRIRLRLTDISETLPYNICNCLVLCEREDC